MRICPDTLISHDLLDRFYPEKDHFLDFASTAGVNIIFL